ncbi:hypothetical protein [Myceligenerans indicum]|uniref:Uncharacterized protein n=1 Tax=Myceligenerans indicum TaxID=2593663 RepID=A0ABS1LH05_9MICO|nr:hypothetical protein [Myceligenerans indicum]MBL0885439.1 hypothetical protein [Myceligenerans indicum]
MTRRLAGFQLRLPESWFEVPDGVPDVTEWARTAAEAMLAAATVPPDTDAGQAVENAPEEAQDDPVAALAEQLVDVAGSVRDTGIRGLETAVLVRRPDLGIVDAMITLVGQQGLGRAEFDAQLTGAVEDSEDAEHVFAGTIDAAVPAGDASGMHLMIGHLRGTMGEGVAVLEERVAMGVFPPGCPDMVEVTAIARSAGVFDDMAQAVVDMMEGLTIELEPVA